MLLERNKAQLEHVPNRTVQLEREGENARARAVSLRDNGSRRTAATGREPRRRAKRGIMDAFENNELATRASGMLAKIVPSKDVYLYDPPSGSDVVYRWRVVFVAILVALALVCALPLRAHFSNAETHSATMETIDEKKANVMGMIATSTSLSVGISAIPDDVGSAASEQLMDISANLGIVLGVLYLEKYLLTILSGLGFGAVLPIALGLLAIATWTCRKPWAPGVGRFAAKGLLFGIILVTIIPASVTVSNMIDQAYETSVATQAEQQALEDEQAKAEADKKAEEKPWYSFITDIPGNIASGAKKLGDDALAQINTLIESFAVMVVTSCVMPILVLMFSLWVANILLGIDISAPTGMLRERAAKMKPRKSSGGKGRAELDSMR